MRLDMFVESERNRLERFKARWLDAHKVAPESYPLDMDAGDWDEALYSWEDGPFYTEGLE